MWWCLAKFCGLEVAEGFHIRWRMLAAQVTASAGVPPRKSISECRPKVHRQVLRNPRKHPRNSHSLLEFSELALGTFGLVSRAKLCTPPPPTPISGHKAFFRGGGWGCIFWGPTRQEFYTPPPLIHPPPLGGSFQGWGGGACIKFGPVSSPLNQEWPRQTKPKKGRFMNFSQGHSGTKVRCVNRACFSPGKTPEFTKNRWSSWTFRFGLFFGLVCRGDSWLKTPTSLNQEEAFLLTAGAFLLTVKLLCLQSVKALLRRTFPL